MPLVFAGTPHVVLHRTSTPHVVLHRTSEDFSKLVLDLEIKLEVLATKLRFTEGITLLLGLTIFRIGFLHLG